MGHDAKSWNITTKTLELWPVGNQWKHFFSLGSSPRESGGTASAGRISALGSDEALTVNKMMATWMCNGRNNLETSLCDFAESFTSTD